MDITYTVDSENVVRIFDDINPEPFILQPHHPDGTEFTSETAQAWAEEFIVDWTARQAEEERRREIKISAKAKLVAGQPLTEEEVAILLP